MRACETPPHLVRQLKSLSQHAFQASEDYLATLRPDETEFFSPSSHGLARPCESLPDLVREVRSLSCRLFNEGEGQLATLRPTRPKKKRTPASSSSDLAEPGETPPAS